MSFCWQWGRPDWSKIFRIIQPGEYPLDLSYDTSAWEWAIYFSQFMTQVLNHKIIEVGRDLWRPLSWTSCWRQDQHALWTRLFSYCPDRPRKLARMEISQPCWLLIFITKNIFFFLPSHNLPCFNLSPFPLTLLPDSEQPCRHWIPAVRFPVSLLFSRLLKWRYTKPTSFFASTVYLSLPTAIRLVRRNLTF